MSGRNSFGPSAQFMPTRKQRHIGNGIPESLNRLAGHAAIAAGLDERDRRENGNALLVGRVTPCAPLGGQGTARPTFNSLNSQLFQDCLNGKERRLRVQRVEDGFDQQHIRAAVEQAADLFTIGRDQFVVTSCRARRNCSRRWRWTTFWSSARWRPRRSRPGRVAAFSTASAARRAHSAPAFDNS